MAISQDLIDRYETETTVDWFEALSIYHSEFSPSTDPEADTYYIHNGVTENSITGVVDGQLKSFFAAPFQVALPTRDGEGRGDLTINFSFPQTLISEQLEKALANPLEPIIVRYSAFLYADRSVALYDPWLKFYMTEISTNENTVTATCRISDLVNKSFPTGVYRGVNFPGLVRR